MAMPMFMINPELLIQEVANRPSLWNIYCETYKDRNTKIRDWQDIGSTLVPHWDSISPNVRLERVKEFQKRWKNLRDRFVKEHNLSDDNEKKGKYRHYNNLSFLLPTLNSASSRAGSSFEIVVLQNSGYEDETVNPLETQPSSSKKRTSKGKQTTIEGPEIMQNVTKQSLFNPDNIMMELLSDRNDTNGDDDRMFLLSLLPVMKQLSPSKKIKARIGLLQVMQSYQR